MARIWVLSLVSLALACASQQRPDGGTGLLPVGSTTPQLTGKDQSGQLVELREQTGGWTLVYFYPKDDTQGCTEEACAFRDAWQKYRAAAIRVLGVSSDSLESHRSFADKHQLPFSLVVDESGQWARAFGVGSTLGYYSRVSFLIDAKHRVARVYQDVDPARHAARVLRDVAAAANVE